MAESGVYELLRVPWVPSRPEVIELLSKLLKLEPRDVLVDLGCGDGRVAAALARRFNCYTVCVELRSDLVEQAKSNLRSVYYTAEVVQGDIFSPPLRRAHTIYIYLLTTVNAELKPVLKKLMGRDTLLVSLDFPVPGWEPIAVIETRRLWQRSLYIYARGEEAERRINREALDELLRRRVLP